MVLTGKVWLWMTAVVLPVGNTVSGNEGERLEGTARPKRPGPGKRVVDEMSALEMESASAEVTDVERCVFAEALLHGCIPLLDVLRGRMRVEGGKADGGCGQRAGAEHWRAEVQSGGEQRSRRREVIGLLRLREYVRHIVALVAPRVLVNRRDRRCRSAA